jgi:hypothetical protein
LVQLPFLDADQQRLYEETDSGFPRLVRDITAATAARDSPVALVDRVVSNVHSRLQADAARGFRCLGIVARAGDGVSWAATAAGLAAADALGATPVAIRGRTGRGVVPDILGHLRRRAVVKAARHSGINTFRLLPARTVVLIVVAAIVGSGATALLATWSQSAAPQPLLLAVAVALGIGALGVAVRLLEAWLRSTDRPVLNRLAEDVETHRGTDSYRKFVDLLAREFATGRRVRCVVVDDFGRLDPTTKDVLEAYLGRYAVRAANLRGPELWIVFDAYDGPHSSSLSQLVTRHQRLRRQSKGQTMAALGGTLVTLCELEPLSKKQRRDLALAYGFPDRVEYHTVKSIVATDEKSISEAIDSLVPATAQPGEREFAALEMLYLLSLDTLTRGKEVWADKEVVDTFVGQRVRSVVLSQLLTGRAITRGDLATRLRDIREIFANWVIGEDDFTLSFQLDPYVGAVLGTQATRRGLADPRAGHLFWGIYWYDRGEGARQNPLLVEKIARHLTSAGPLAGLGDRLARNATLAGVVFDALVDTARESLKLCRVGHVVALIELAHLMVPQSGPNQARWIRRVRRVAREAYGALGDDRLLPILLDVDSHDPTPSGPGSAGSLTHLFFASLTRAGDGRAGDRAASVANVPELDFFAEVRGATIAVALAPLVGRTPDHLPELVRASWRRIPRLGVAAVEGLVASQHRSAGWSGADLVTLTGALWCWAFAGDPVRRPPDLLLDPEGAAGAEPPLESTTAALSEQLASAYLLAEQLRAARFGDDEPADMDFVLDGLAEELLATTAMSAVTLLTSWRQADIEHVRRDLADVLRSSLAGLQLTAEEPEGTAAYYAEVAQSLDERLSLLRLTWNRLGYLHLADELSLRVAQFALMWRRSGAAVADLTGLIRQPGLRGVLANAAAAEHAMESDGRTAVAGELTAEFVVHAARAALAARLDEDLCGQLCLIAVLGSHVYPSVDCADLLDHLLDQPGADGGYLGRQVAGLDGDNLATLALKLYNLIGNHRRHGEALERLLRRRLSEIPLDEQTAALVDLIDVSAYERACNQGEAPPTSDVLDHWAERRHSKYYPWVLRQVVRMSPRDERVTAEIIDVLTRADEYPSTNGVLQLAYRTLSLLTSGRVEAAALDKDLAVATLRATHRSFGRSQSVDFNLDVLESLLVHDPEHYQEHKRNHSHWLKIQLELDEQRLLPRVVEDETWAALLLSYYWQFRVYGLPVTADTDVSLNARLDPANLDRERDRLVQAATAPIHEDGAKRALSLQFIHDVVVLFRSQLRDDPDLQDSRRLYNMAAEQALPEVYGLLDRLETVPPVIKLILRRHRQFVLDRMESSV